MVWDVEDAREEYVQTEAIDTETDKMTNDEQVEELQDVPHGGDLDWDLTEEIQKDLREQCDKFSAEAISVIVTSFRGGSKHNYQGECQYMTTYEKVVLLADLKSLGECVWYLNKKHGTVPVVACALQSLQSDPRFGWKPP